ncbi:MAG: hypothetical protein DHS80DRAFT_20965 [Piptocephalis tieghemiana]|nr:MAG: hypothetical protein DHS80DRAFT_20965 [Piptocephalis tieghemiana]
MSDPNFTFTFTRTDASGQSVVFTTHDRQEAEELKAGGTPPGAVASTVGAPAPADTPVATADDTTPTEQTTPTDQSTLPTESISTDPSLSSSSLTLTDSSSSDPTSSPTYLPGSSAGIESQDSTAATSSDSSSSSFSSGAIAGLVIGLLAALVVAGLLVRKVRARHQSRLDSTREANVSGFFLSGEDPKRDPEAGGFTSRPADMVEKPAPTVAPPSSYPSAPPPPPPPPMAMTSGPPSPAPMVMTPSALPPPSPTSPSKARGRESWGFGLYLGKAPKGQKKKHGLPYFRNGPGDNPMPAPSSPQGMDLPYVPVGKETVTPPPVPSLPGLAASPPISRSASPYPESEDGDQFMPLPAVLNRSSPSSSRPLSIPEGDEGPSAPSTSGTERKYLVSTDPSSFMSPGFAQPSEAFVSPFTSSPPSPAPLSPSTSTDNPPSQSLTRPSMDSVTTGHSPPSDKSSFSPPPLPPMPTEEEEANTAWGKRSGASSSSKADNRISTASTLAPGLKSPLRSPSSSSPAGSRPVSSGTASVVSRQQVYMDADMPSPGAKQELRITNRFSSDSLFDS